jgi:hypothetical protein
VAQIVTKLNRRAITDAGTLACYTGNVFSAVATLIGNVAVQHAVDLANDHLYFTRTLECRYIDDVQDELRRLCELLLSGRRDELVAEINAYHSQRFALLPILLCDARP